MRTPGTEGYARAVALLNAGVCPDCEIVLASRPKPGDRTSSIRAKEWFDNHATRGADLSWRWSDEAALIFFSESPEEDGRRVGSRAGRINGDGGGQ